MSKFENVLKAPVKNSKSRASNSTGQVSENSYTQTVNQKRGRKPGKHSDENYTQTSLYLPIELRNRVRAKLYEQGKEMSGLVEDMLRDWLGKQS